METFREPTLDDGAGVWTLIKETGVLDLNSSYSYLMWCSVFSDTSVVVEADGQIVGFISGFIKPASPDKLFIWQVAVDGEQRGKGLASKMLHHILERDICENVRYVEATVSPSNTPSRKLFNGLARSLDTNIEVSDCFTAEDFPEEGHEDELMHLIGPFK
ncbi:Diaminobutyrate acetyltransferase [Lentibacillus sp. JNUCC-1]|uniref:diaminobutyrate acetyltransferase n=1 Tax=Lentibacillus sp. JNUCC-1 TaxID=2654513 RepID=UPI0012E96D28|nr:diaminobutyrate acetyltransferase [Lentibacillus sp. JNUCC-1]MUV37793.1 Diaminobutyrate acetyltransferase [Lentibacillus sp. JNUCC-1]